MKAADVYVDVESVLEALGVDVDFERGSWADALCPFHEESRPSFSVNLEHGGWVCRHGGETGNLIKLVSEIKGLSRREAADWLRAVPEKTYTSDDVLDKLFQLSKELEVDASEIIEWAERYDELDPAVMSDYWFERGFTARTMREFEVRYDGEDNSIVWPVRDENANLIGFVKRYVKPISYSHKYDYPKGFSRSLYPLDHVVPQSDEVVLVEGSLDALWLHQLGYSNVLALLGSGVTRKQAQWLRNNVRLVTLMFDNDTAGKEGTRTAVKQLSGLSVKVAAIPEELKDPQQMTKEQVRTAFTCAKYAVERGTV